MRAIRMRISAVVLIQLFIVLGFLGSWEALVQMNRGLEFFFGRPSRIAVYIASRLFDGSLEADSAAAVIEAVCGFLIGNIAGILVGLALWYSKVAFEVSRPFITALGSAPMFALAPL